MVSTVCLSAQLHMEADQPKRFRRGGHPLAPILDAERRVETAHKICPAHFLPEVVTRRKAAQEKGREVTQTDEDAHEAASGVGDDAVK
jgi:hypothetical protein